MFIPFLTWADPRGCCRTFQVMPRCMGTQNVYKQSETKVSKPYPVEVLNLLDSSIPPTDCYEIIESGENIVEIECNISYFDP